MKNQLTFYYETQSLAQIQDAQYTTKNTKKKLFSDEALTNQIGYTIAKGEFFNTEQDVLAFYQCLFLTGKNNFFVQYIKVNNDAVQSQINFSNVIKDVSKSNFEREVLENGTTRKVTISYD